MKYTNSLVSYLLSSERGRLFCPFFLPCQNSLKKGVTLDDAGASCINKIRWISVVIGFVLFFSIEDKGDALFGVLLTLLMFICAILLSLALLGFKYKNEIQDVDVVPFDIEVAKSGGMWGTLGIVVWSLYKLLFSA